MAAVEDCMMEQLVPFPTQVKGNILDLIITNIPERVEEVSEHGRLGKSDHVIIVTKIQRAGQQIPKKQCQNWRRANWQAMKEELREMRIQQSIRYQRADEAWDTFRCKIEELIEKHVPKRRPRNNNRPAWLSQEILREIRRKKRLWKQCNRKATDEYKEVEKRVKNLIRNAKRKFEKKLSEGNGGNKRPFFAYVREKTQSRPSIGPLKDKQGKVVTDDEGMAELLNKAFKDVFTREDTTGIPTPESKWEGPFLEDVKFRTAEVKKKIRTLKQEGAAGPDGIGPKILRELQEELFPVLASIYCIQNHLKKDWCQMIGRRQMLPQSSKRGQKAHPTITGQSH
jgi:hypothetical protein